MSTAAVIAIAPTIIAEPPRRYALPGPDMLTRTQRIARPERQTLDLNADPELARDIQTLRVACLEPSVMTHQLTTARPSLWTRVYNLLRTLVSRPTRR